MKMKKLLAVALSAMLMASAAVGFASCNPTNNDPTDTLETRVNRTPDYSYLTEDLTGKTLKVGTILIGNETEGYTKAHMDGMEAAKKQIEAKGGSVVITHKKNLVDDNSQCATELNTLASNGNELVITNSYGHQNWVKPAEGQPLYEKYPNVTFISMTGDMAAGAGVDNYKNAFTSVYEARYLSGVVAGYKVKELVENDKLTAKNYSGGKVKIGYVGAFPFAEVLSGYTAFFLGIQSVYPDVTMTVQYTSSWFDLDGEKAAAQALISDGCVIISQHADSVGAPTACEEEYNKGTVVYSIGYNVSMFDAAPNAALTSATNMWEVYYTYAFYTAMTSANGGKDIVTDWTKAFKDGAVGLTKINDDAFTDKTVATKVAEDAAKLLDGSLKVFDTSKFTVGGETITSYTNAFGMNGAECIKTEGGKSWFDESIIRSAPYFDIRIDGITELTQE